MNKRLIAFKITVDIAMSVAEFNGIRAAGGSERNDDYMLHIGVHHGVVDNAAHTIIDGDAYIAEALVEADVDVIVAGTGYNSVRANV